MAIRTFSRKKLSGERALGEARVVELLAGLLAQPTPHRNSPRNLAERATGWRRSSVRNVRGPSSCRCARGRTEAKKEPR
jgi:hypothetical protein